MSARRKRHDEPVVVTSAPTNPSDEINRREKRYLISMGIRTACFIGAVFAFTGGLTWLGIILLIASFLLPGFAVIIANAGNPRIEGTPVDPRLYHREIGPGAEDRDDQGDR